MTDLVVLVLEDEQEVRDAVLADLGGLGSKVRLVAAEDVDDAVVAMKEIQEDGDQLGLILADHRLPGRSGVDFLISLQQDDRTRAIRKVLLTGQAGHEDTIRAINQAGLNRYVSKPWDAQGLRRLVVDQLTDFVLASELDPLPFVRDLDGPRLLESIARGGFID